MALDEKTMEMATLVSKVTMKSLIEIHAPRMSVGECYKRVTEDMATICVLVKEGILVVSEIAKL